MSSRLIEIKSSRPASNNSGTHEENESPKSSGGKTRRRRKGSSVSDGGNDESAGSAMKSIALPGVGGTLTISGTFNPFGLNGEERKLVYGIIDMMNEFEKLVGSKKEH